MEVVYKNIGILGLQTTVRDESFWPSTTGGYDTSSIDLLLNVSVFCSGVIPLLQDSVSTHSPIKTTLCFGLRTLIDAHISGLHRALITTLV